MIVRFDETPEFSRYRTIREAKIRETYLRNIVGESIEDAMEGENGDPYEEQLLAVFESCLEKGRAELSSEGLRALCDKLQLEERSRLLISLLSPGRGDASVTFATFRDGLLKLLGQNEGNPCHFGEVERADDSDASAGTEGAASRDCRQKISKDKSCAFPPGRADAATSGESSEMRESSVVGYASLCKQMPPEQMFAKLDSDGDGLISLDEFVLLFEEEIALDRRNGAWSEVAKTLDEERTPVRVLGAQQTGYARMSTIVGMWEVAGVTDAAILLSDLGFTSNEINLGDLTIVLCEELKNLRDEPADATSTHTSLLKGALTLYQEEVRSMITLVEHLRGERDKLRVDVAEANERANLLAQEIDEHHARLEKSRQDQLKQLEIRHSEITRSLSIRCTLEREAHTAASRALDDQLRAAQQEEQQVRAKLADVLRENQSLESEVEKLCDQITKLKTSNAQLLMKIQDLAAEHEEVEESNGSEDSQRIIQLVERIKRLQEEIALLRDQNDELSTELEFTKNRIHGKPLDDDDDNDESRDGVEVVGSLDNFIKDSRSVSTSPLSQISPIFPDELPTNNEDECEERTSESLRDLVVARNEKSKLVKCRSHSDDTIDTIEKSVNNFETKSSSNNNTPRNRTSGLRDYPPRREESTSPEFGKIDVVKTEAGQENFGTEESEAKDAIGKKQLIDRCAELERSLDLLRSEYEECEDYWAGKLEEERQIFEQEQKISDDKFSELIAKIAEYEEQFGPGEKPPPPRNDGRLSPIEEKFYLEQQYTDLEDEYERFRTRTRQALSHRDNEIKELQDKLSREKRRPSTDATTQFSDNDEGGGDGEEKKLPRRRRDETNEPSGPSSPPPPEHSLPPTHYSLDSHASFPLLGSPSKKLLRYDATSINRQLLDHNKFNEIACESIDSIDAIPSVKLGDCYCQQIEAYNSMEELCRLHKAELHRLYRKKLEIDNECVNLARQKETLIKGVSDLKNLTLVKRLCPPEDEDDGNCGLSINILKTLNERLQVQEKKRRNLKMSLVHQQQQAERILQQTWHQHCQEVAALHFALQATKEQLKRQLEVNHEQTERLAKADILSTDLYVQNAHLMASVKRLEQHCHMLAQFGGESTSV